MPRTFGIHVEIPNRFMRFLCEAVASFVKEVEKDQLDSNPQSQTVWCVPGVLKISASPLSCILFLIKSQLPEKMRGSHEDGGGGLPWQPFRDREGRGCCMCVV